MIVTTRIFEIQDDSAPRELRKLMAKTFGSKRSGTVYIVAKDEGDAVRVYIEACRLWFGISAKPDRISASPTHLVNEALIDR